LGLIPKIAPETFGVWLRASVKAFFEDA